MFPQVHMEDMPSISGWMHNTGSSFTPSFNTYTAHGPLATCTLSFIHTHTHSLYRSCLHVLKWAKNNPKNIRLTSNVFKHTDANDSRAFPPLAASLM